MGMRRFSKKPLAFSVVALTALAILLAVWLDRRWTPVPLRCLQYRIPVVRNPDTRVFSSTTSYLYDFEADFDSVATEAVQQLTAAGFTASRDDRPSGRKFVEYCKGYQQVFLQGYGTRAPDSEWVHVEVWIPNKPSFWERLIATIRETLGL